MKGASQYSFSSVPRVEMQRSAFKRDRSYKTAFNSGYLIPFFTDEVYPGDTFNCMTQAFARLATPVLPFMDNLYMDFFFFYVPYRLLWEHWNNFLGEQAKPNDTTDYLTPILGSARDDSEHMETWYKDKLISVESESLFDYLGFPVGTFGTKDDANGLVINAFLPRAYNKIWNDHFRDENLQDPVHEYTDDGPDYQVPLAEEAPVLRPENPHYVNYRLLRRGKRKDYFTSALPWPQKGPGAEISIGGTAPVYGDGHALALQNTFVGRNYLYGLGVLSNNTNSVGYFGSSGDGETDIGNIGSTGTVALTNKSMFGVSTKDALADDSHFNSSGLFADLSTATPVSINDLRMAFQLQRLMEKDARSGTRAPEIILGHFNTICPDFRLQRTEFLGGGEIPIQIHQVTQTSSTDATSPQGNTAAFGIASGRVGFSKSFVEHGLVMGLVSVRADLNYQQGIHRSWTRRSRYDYYWPSLAHLGEQAILNKEIFATGVASVDDAAFGYQERWAELRYGVSQITGKLRSGVSGSLDVWHLAQNFSNLPQLNSEFIEDNPPVSRVVAVDTEPQIVFDSKTVCSCVRPLPMYSVPGLIDHL